MKKITAFCLSFLLILTLAACGSQRSENTGASQPGSKSVQEQAEAPVEEIDKDPAAEPVEVPVEISIEAPEPDEGKALVVYFSATGNTEDAANYIAAAAGAGLFELAPVEPYSDEDLNWRNESSRVVYEHDNPEARVVALAETTVPDWEAYDTIFIGYPIWWGIAAWPVDGFVQSNDFTGKTVIPFCTSSDSGLGESGELLAEAAGAGDWLEGMRFSSNVSESDVQAWVEGLGL